jgi:hypothetical protein
VKEKQRTKAVAILKDPTEHSIECDDLTTKNYRLVNMQIFRKKALNVLLGKIFTKQGVFQSVFIYRVHFIALYFITVRQKSMNAL